MPLMINTNIASLNAQRNLQSSQNALATSLQRLSSGLRINSAKDDAAGLAISQRFTSQINGLDQSVRNANDAISLSQTAEGDMVQIGDNLQRIRELAVQSANATNSADDRKALQQEASQLISEINRVASNSNFNGTNLLDGTFTNKNFQVGANVGQTISIASIASAKTADMGTDLYTQTAAGGATAITAANTLTINGTSVQASVDTGATHAAALANGTDSGSAYAVANAINASNIAGVSATASTTVTDTASFGTVTTGATGTYDLNINGVDVLNVGASATVTGQNVVDAINQNTASTGVTAKLNSGKLELDSADGHTINVTQTIGGTGATGAGTTIATPTVGKVTLNSTSTQGLTIASAGGAGGFTTGTTIVSATKLGNNIANTDISTVNGANNAIAAVDAALKSINSSRAALGAYQNRFTSVIASLQTTAENLTASRSRIQDADFASETASLTKNQILQQAGTAMLAQANQLPNGVMALLR